MTPAASDLKATLRRQLREEACRHTPAERKVASEQICLRLREQESWQLARSILFFAPLVEEPDVWRLVSEALNEGKTVALPRYSRSRKDYEAGQIENPDRQLQIGYFGIREPDETCPIILWNKLDFVLVPGIGFALDGGRLGRGKGYYDRLLARVSGMKCGVAFDWQVTAKIPAEPHDIRLDCILTPTRWHPVVPLRRF